jgi:NitT/TauT family transport system permease protein
MYALMLFVLIVAIVINAVLYTWEQRILRRRGRA